MAELVKGSNQKEPTIAARPRQPTKEGSNQQAPSAHKRAICYRPTTAGGIGERGVERGDCGADKKKKSA